MPTARRLAWRATTRGGGADPRWRSPAAGPSPSRSPRLLAGTPVGRALQRLLRNQGEQSAVQPGRDRTTTAPINPIFLHPTSCFWSVTALFCGDRQPALADRGRAVALAAVGACYRPAGVLGEFNTHNATPTMCWQQRVAADYPHFIGHVHLGPRCRGEQRLRHALTALRFGEQAGDSHL